MEHPSLNKQKEIPRLEKVQEQFKRDKTIQVLPLGIIETAPLVEAIGSNAKLSADAFAETVIELKNIKETVDSTELNAKIDRLLSIFTEIRDNERAFFVKVEAELNR